jgi:hypothetical protein
MGCDFPHTQFGHGELKDACIGPWYGCENREGLQGLVSFTGYMRCWWMSALPDSLDKSSYRTWFQIHCVAVHPALVLLFEACKTWTWYAHDWQQLPVQYLGRFERSRLEFKPSWLRRKAKATVTVIRRCWKNQGTSKLCCSRLFEHTSC